MDVKKQSTIFIRNFAHKYNNSLKLKEGFERFGSIENVFILETPHNDLIGYVEYKEKNSAIKAIDVMDDFSLPDGRSMKVGLVKECNDSINNLYIKNLPESVDDNVLDTLFKKYGTIISATVMRDEENKSRGFGFVCFESDIDAAVARKDMNGFEISGKKFDISFAQKKENREAYLTAQKKGILKQAEVKKRLPLELRAVRRPTQSELMNCTVPCLEQMPPYGNMTGWYQMRAFSNSVMKLPTMNETYARPPVHGDTTFLNMSRQHHSQTARKPVQKTMQWTPSNGKQSKISNTNATKRTETVVRPQPTEQTVTSTTSVPNEERKDILQDIILPQLKKMYAPYATLIMERFMNREYKDLLRLARNHRLLYKEASSEVQKLKSNANMPKRP